MMGGPPPAWPRPRAGPGPSLTGRRGRASPQATPVAAGTTAPAPPAASSPLHAALNLPPSTSGCPTPRAEVRAAWRRIARRTHPDTLPPGTPPTAVAAAAAALARARAAAGVLGDAGAAAAYAASGLDSLPPGARALFADAVAPPPSLAAQAAPVRGRDVGAVILLTWEEAALGTAREVELGVEVACGACSLGGAARAAGPAPAPARPGFTSCRACGGGGGALYSRTAAPLALGWEGEGAFATAAAAHRRPADAALLPPRPDPRLARGAPANPPGPPGPAAVLGTCPACGGGGDAARAWCGACGGKGLAPGRRSVTVRVPPGVRADATLRVAGAGGAGLGGGAPGDAYLYVAVDPSPHGFTRGSEGIRGSGAGGGGSGSGSRGQASAAAAGPATPPPPLPLPGSQAPAAGHAPPPLPAGPDDVASTLALSAGEAVLGVAALAVRTLRGAASLTVPPGTQPGATLVLEGAGIDGGVRGDGGGGGAPGGRGRHLFRVVVVVPGVDDLGEGARAAVERLRALQQEARGERGRGGG